LQRAETKSGSQKILNFLSAADITITDFQLETKKFSVKMLPNGIPTELKEQLTRELGDKNLTKIKFFHPLIGSQEKVAFDLQDESDGTQRLFEFAGLCLDMLDKGKILLMSWIVVYILRLCVF